MRRLAVAVLMASVALATGAPASASPDTECRLVTPVQEVTSTSQIPPGLITLIGPIADVGAPFNATDAVDDPTLPFRRLIRAGHLGDEWFVWYEHGGIAYFWQMVVARVSAGGSEVTPVSNASTVSDTLCSTTDGVFAGTVPPYPQGAWPATSY